MADDTKKDEAPKAVNPVEYDDLDDLPPVPGPGQFTTPDDDKPAPKKAEQAKG